MLVRLCCMYVSMYVCIYVSGVGVAVCSWQLDTDSSIAVATAADSAEARLGLWSWLIR